MSSYLCLCITFLDPAFHGRGDSGEPEWPPSPLRLYQALLAVSAAQGGGHPSDRAVRALQWLERQPAPLIVAPGRHVGIPVRIAVPNNDMDIPMQAWAANRPPAKQPNELKTMKTVRPSYLRGSDAVHYLYTLNGDDGGHVETLCEVARCLVQLGWGVDLVAGHGRVIGDGGEDDPRRSQGCETWQPSDVSSRTALRIPQPGTLVALTHRHGAFLNRLSAGGYSPLPPLTAFAVVSYRRAADPPSRPFAAFDIWKPISQLAALKSGQSRYRPFDPVLRTITVAGMVRHAAACAAVSSGWRQGRINTFIHGHSRNGDAQATGPEADRRLAFLPLPTISPLRVESIRRALVVAPPQDGSQITWVRQALSGRELFPEENPDPVAMLSPLPDSETTVQRYVAPAQAWATVTPVVLPGRYSKGPGRARRLLLDAFEQAGWPRELVEAAELEWRNVGFLPGVDLASRYQVGQHHEHLPRYHIRVRWPAPVRGPIVVGAGRYRGLGLFASG